MTFEIGISAKRMRAVLVAIKAIVAVSIVAACGAPPVSDDQVREASDAAPVELSTQALTEAEAIFDYAYPLVIMKISQDLMLTVPIRPRTTPNHFIHFRRLAQPEQRAVVLGNRNTLYSVGWLDLSAGPVVFEIPDMGDRYYVMPLLDAWTNTFESLGSRTTGQAAQKYLIAHENFSGDVPDGHTLIRSPTNMVWITGRVQADSAEDAKTVALLQDEYVLMSLEEQMTGVDPFADYAPQYTFGKVRLPVPYSLQMEAAEFYNTFFEMAAANPGPQADEDMFQLLSDWGIDLSAPLRFENLSLQTQAALQAGLKSKQSAYSAAFYSGTAQSEPWLFNLDPAMGNWGADFARRAYWAMWGLGTNISQDAVYGVTQLDQTMQPLNGQNTYRLHFEADELPPTQAFWSVTNYDVEGYLERNAQDRYSLGSNHQLNFNQDGSLDLYLSYAPPAQDGANWIPAPEGEFKILLRIYWPQEIVLTGAWSLPDVERLP
ncbi:MAG: DUF1254 domain-containing protein [Pseudomonadota bacterium]